MAKVVYRVGPGGAAAAYSYFVEFGTRYMAAQPYMRPAFEEHKDGLAAEIDRMVGQVIAANRI